MFDWAVKHRKGFGGNKRENGQIFSTHSGLVSLFIKLSYASSEWEVNGESEKPSALRHGTVAGQEMYQLSYFILDPFYSGFSPASGVEIAHVTIITC